MTTTLVFLLVTGAGLLAGVGRSAWLGRLRDGAWIAIVASAAALAFPSTTGLILVIGLVAWVLATITHWPNVAARDGPRVAFLLIVILCAWRRFNAPWLDYFETGCSLSPAQSYLAGARPYLDVAPIHGWGSDGGFDAWLFRFVGASVRAFMLREAVGSVLAFLALAALSFVALGAGWGSLATVLGLIICPFLFSRQVLAFGSTASLVHSVKARSLRSALLAGSLASLQAFYSLEYGMVLFAGGLVGLGLLTLWDRASGDSLAPVRRTALAFAAGAVLAGVPFVILLLAHGSLSAFLRSSFLEVSGWAEAVWGMPARGVWAALPFAFVRTTDPDVHPAFILLVLGLCGAVLLFRAVSSSADPVDRAVLVCYSVSVAALRPMLGRADGPHLARYGVFAAVPLAWLMMRAWKSGPLRLPLAGVLAAATIAALHPIPALRSHLEIIENSARLAKTQARLTIPRSGGASLPLSDAERMTAFRGYCDTHLGRDETFFDFANQPTLYFIADRQAPIRYMTVAQYEEPERQREVVRTLERQKPPLVILPKGMYASLDGVSNAERAPLVARYIAQHYEADQEVGGWLLGRRRDSVPAGR